MDMKKQVLGTMVLLAATLSSAQAEMIKVSFEGVRSSASHDCVRHCGTECLGLHHL